MSVRRLIPLSELSAGRRNPRRVRPEREAHRRLVASIKAVGLLQPLIVRPINGNANAGYQVVAGKRRLDALRDVYRDAEADPPIKCEVEAVDDAVADQMALAENFAREGMHPLDEAEAFARLADAEAKGVNEVAAEFGVTPRYVRQRMKLAGLADAVKAAYRAGEIDTATAEVFASVPALQQLAVWREAVASGGGIRHAQHASNLIRHDWIDARLARFDLDTLPDGAVSTDLFNDGVLVERRAFMEAQAEAVSAEAEAMKDDGWGEVVVAPREAVYDRLVAMGYPEPDYDEPTKARLTEIAARREALEAEVTRAEETEGAADSGALDALYERCEAVDREEQDVIDGAEPVYAEPVKAVATVFLMIGPDGNVDREVRVPKPQGGGSSAGVTGDAVAGAGVPGAAKPPTSEDLGDRQREAALVHDTLAVRSALLADCDDAKRARRVLLALMLCDSLGSHDGLLVRLEPDPIARHVETRPKDRGPFVSEAWDALQARRAELDPFAKSRLVDTAKAYERIAALPDDRLDALIDLLIVRRLAGNLHRRSDLVARLAHDLGVDLRTFWTPDAEWFAGYKKIQLAHLLGKLRGRAAGVAAERRKKSELVEALARLFADARDGTLDAPRLAEKANAWLPPCVRPHPRPRKPSGKKGASTQPDSNSDTGEDTAPQAA